MQNAFDVMICGPEGGRSKPAPDIYLEAARRLGLEPGECLGVEDSRNGLRSLTAAGCVSVMIPDLLPYDDSLAPYCEAPAFGSGAAVHAGGPAQSGGTGAGHDRSWGLWRPLRF